MTNLGNKIEFAKLANDRLFAYYAKHVFELASHTSRVATQMQAERKLQPQLN